MVKIWNVHITEICLSATVNIFNSDDKLKITTVYGPSTSGRKDDFFNELRGLKPPSGSNAWLSDT
jgi:hypothetical protein